MCKNPGSRDYWIGRDWSVAAGNVCRPLRKRRLRPSEYDDGLGPSLDDDDDDDDGGDDDDDDDDDEDDDDDDDEDDDIEKCKKGSY